MELIPKEELLFKANFTMIVSGSTGVGKSRFVLKLVENMQEMIDKPVTEVIYFYGIYSSTVNKIEQMGHKAISGFPSEEDIQKFPKNSFVILDDLMMETNESSNQKLLNSMFTRDSHHVGFSVCLILQNLFQNKSIQVCRTNSHYIYLLGSKNAALSVRTLGSMLFPGKLSYFLDAYSKSIKENFNGLLIDLHPASNPKFSLRTHLFPDEETTIFLPL